MTFASVIVIFVLLLVAASKLFELFHDRKAATAREMGRNCDKIDMIKKQKGRRPDLAEKEIIMDF